MLKDGSGARRRRFEAQTSHLFFIALLTLVFYARSLDNYWIKDDLGIGIFTDGRNLTWEKLAPYMWPSFMTSEQFWRPVPLLLGWVEWRFWGTNPAGYHLTNTLLHALVAILVYLLANRLTDFAHPGVGLVAALAAALDPINPESVVWVLQRMVLLCALFCLWSLLLRLRAAESGCRRSGIAALVTFALALLCKEIAVTLPAAYFMIDFFRSRGPSDFRSRWRRAWKGTLVPALLIAVYLGCRFALWGRVDIRYGGLEPQAYARQNRVFELLGQSLFHGAVPVNAGIFGGATLFVLRALIGGVLLIGLFAAIGKFRRSDAFRTLAAVALAFGLGSFLPTLMIFWIDERLFNARFFYGPGIGLAMFTAGALWLPTGPQVAGSTPPSPGRRLLPRILTGIWLGAYAVSLAGGLAAFEAGGRQVRAIQQACLGYAERERREGDEPLLVAFNVPSQVQGVPTLEYSLALALEPPLAGERGVDCIPLLDVHHHSEEWPERLEKALSERGRSLARVRYVECIFDPPGIRPVFGAKESPAGAYPAELLLPVDNAFLTNDPALPEPVFRFRSAPEATRFSIRFDNLDLPAPLLTALEPGRNLKQEPDGSWYWSPSFGDAGTEGGLNLWRDLVQASQPHPIPLLWRIESRDAQGRLVGVSAAHRLLVFDVH